MGGPGLDLDDLARQRVGHVDGAGGAVRNTFAARAQPGNPEPLNHGFR